MDAQPENSVIADQSTDNSQIESNLTQETPSSKVIEYNSEKQNLQDESSTKVSQKDILTNFMPLSSQAKFEKLMVVIDNTVKNMGEILKEKERLKIRTLETKINHSYYNLWRQEANSVFRRLVMLKIRRQRVIVKKNWLNV